MYIRNSKIFTIACFLLLSTACSNEPTIKSATSEKVTVGGPPEKFTSAYELAKNECLKYTKTAEYIPDTSVGLKEVAFNCVGPETEEETVATGETTAEGDAGSEEVSNEAENNPEETGELPTSTEDELTEAEAGDTQESQ